MDFSKADAQKADAQAPAGAFLPVPFVARPRFGRIAVLITAIALSAALGSMVGAWAASVFARPVAQPVPTVIARTDDAAIARLSADIAALKAAVDNMAKADVAKADANKASHAQLVRLGEAVEKLERKTAAVFASSSDVTGSIASKQAALAPKQQDKPPVVSGWVIREVYDGVAMIESRYGLYEVPPGANLPGIGRVETIRRQDGRWVAVTPKGLIVSMR